MKTHTIAPCACPGCRYVFDRQTSLKTGKGPEPGDFTICLRCALVLRFNDDLSIRRMTSAELAELDLDTYAEIQTVRSAIMQLRPGVR